MYEGPQGMEGYFGTLRDVTTTDINYSISTITSSGWDQSSEPSAGTIWITTVNYASDTTVTVQTEARTLTYDWVNWGDASITKSHQENAYTRTITRVWE